MQAFERIDQTGVVGPLPALKVEVHTDGSEPPRLRLQGEIDIATVPVLRECLAELVNGGGDLVVDLADVEFIGLAGLELLCDQARYLHWRGDRLVVSSPPPIARRVIDIIGMADLLVLADEDT